MKALTRALVLAGSSLATLFLAACTTPPPLETTEEGETTEERAPDTGIFRSDDDGTPAPGERYAVPYSREFDQYGPRNPYGWR